MKNLLIITAWFFSIIATGILVIFLIWLLNLDLFMLNDNAKMFFTGFTAATFFPEFFKGIKKILLGL